VGPDRSHPIGSRQNEVRVASDETAPSTEAVSVRVGLGCSSQVLRSEGEKNDQCRKSPRIQSVTKRCANPTTTTVQGSRLISVAGARLGSIGLSRFDLFLPFISNNSRQRAARPSKHESGKSFVFLRLWRSIPHHPARTNKARLTFLFPPVNRRVVGSNPT
jgi:hypothetical protein